MHPSVRALILLVVLLVALFSVQVRAASTTLSWSPSPSQSVIGYSLYYGTASGQYSAKVDLGNVNTATLSNLGEGVTYFYAVTARNAVGESAPSNEVSATTPYQAPVAGFIATPASGSTPLTVSFSNTTTGAVSSYQWNFGDGTTGSGVNESHTYTAPGSYSVSLTATGPSGLTSTVTQPNVITVGAPSTLPVAGFTVSPSSGVAPLSVSFTNASINATSYQWNFGDGTSGAEVNPIKTFGIGTYTVTLTASNANGSNAVSKLISVSAPPSSQSYTIWAANATPPEGPAFDPNPVELGVKFKADVAGKIVALRFYRHPANAGPHTLSLWSATGTLLGRATTAVETSSGWQQANLSTPVSIAPGQVYVASYFVASKNYAFSQNYFATKGVDNGPLHALKNGVSGGNGVYTYGASPRFPKSTYSATNYWVDVVFVPNN